VRPRALRLLRAGGAPAGWLRQAGRAAARLGALDRGVAWTGELARISPQLRTAPLWGDTLGPLALSVPARPSSSSPSSAASAADEGGGALPGGFPRRTSPSDASPSTRTDATARGRTGRRVPPPSRQHPSPPDRASSASSPPFSSASHSTPPPASLPRRAGEGVLRRWDPAGDGRAGGHSRRPGAAAFGDHDPFVIAPAGGERRVWTPTPQSLPILSGRDRLQGWAAGRAQPDVPQPDVPQPAFARGEGDARWIARVASAAARRLPFSARRVDDRVGMDAALADEWAWPLDGPTVPADVLTRLAARARTAPRAPAPPSGGRGHVATHPPATARRPLDATPRGGDDASAVVRRPPRLAAWNGEDASAALAPSPHPLFRPRRAAPAADVERSISRVPHAVRSPGSAADVQRAPGDAKRGVDDGIAARDRWSGWPTVLSWPRREARSGGAGRASGSARRAWDGDAATAAEPPRLARSVAGEAPLPAPPVADAARGISGRGTSAVATRSASIEGGGTRDGWLIDTLRARSQQPGLSVEPGGATIPIHPALAAETAELRGGIPGVVGGAPPLAWMAGAGAVDEADALGELDDLAGRVRRILEDEVRRHGIDV